MPYCHKCGSKLDEDAKFCHVCGTPVTPIPTVTPRAAAPPPRRTHPLPLAAAILIAILVIAVVTTVIIFLPVVPVSFNQSNEASAANVNSLNLTIDADIANVNVSFRNLPGNQLAVVNVSATGSRGIFGTDTPLALASQEKTENSTLKFTTRISRADPWTSLYSLNVACDVYIDPSANLNLTVRTGTGQTEINAGRSVSFQGVHVETSTGSVEARLTEGTVISGSFSLQTATGTVQLLWAEADVSGNVPVNLRTNTGSVDINITQTRSLTGNVTLNAETSTGGVSLRMDIRNDVGAKVSATTVIGGVSVEQKGFSGNTAPLQSSNYPAGSNFLINLETNTGGIDINAVYELGGVRS